MSQEPKDGTPDDAKDDAEAGGTPSGTPDDAGTDDKGKLIATLQAKAADANRLQAELDAEREKRAELEKWLEETRRTTATPPTTGHDAEEQKLQATYLKLKTAADAGDEGAYFILKTNEALFNTLNDLKRDRQWDRIPDAQRKGAEEYYKTGDYRTPEAARKAWLGDLTDEARQALNGKPEHRRPAREPERDEVVDTATRPLSPAGVTARRLSPADWTKAWDKAEAAGDDKTLDELRRTPLRQ